MQPEEPGFARVDPLRGRVAGGFQERANREINHERSRSILSAQLSTEPGQLHIASRQLGVLLEQHLLQLVHHAVEAETGDLAVSGAALSSAV